MTSMTLCLVHVSVKPMLNSKLAHQITPELTKTWKMKCDVIKGVTSIDLGWPQDCHNVSANHENRLASPIPVHITSRNAIVGKLQAWKRYGTQIPLNITLAIKSEVKDHGRYGLETFREDVKLFQG